MSDIAIIIIAAVWGSAITTMVWAWLSLRDLEKAMEQTEINLERLVAEHDDPRSIPPPLKTPVSWEQLELELGLDYGCDIAGCHRHEDEVPA